MRNSIQNTRRAVATMANALRKTGLTLSEAWKKAWRRIKATMTFRAVGVTFENRQSILRWFSQFQNLTATLEREADNKHDANAIKIVLHAEGKRGCIGYVNRTLAETLAKVIDKGVELRASASIIGGYDYKEQLGCLVTIEA